jgi:5-oxoprolinase (ATP-hydrolysing) subunit C
LCAYAGRAVMMRVLEVVSVGPAVTVQDSGRPGYLAFGLSRGGAADGLALAQGAALLGQDRGCAALEMAGFGGVFAFAQETRIALSGAPMRATLDGAALVWNASYRVGAGQRLALGAVTAGVYGYLSLGGGIATEPLLGSRAAHLTAGLGRALVAGDRLPLGRDDATGVGMALAATDHVGGGLVRILPTAQTGMFAPEDRARFEATAFRRDNLGNRQGVRLAGGGGFATEGQRSLLSEIVQPGDIQMIGDGVPYVLLAECQTMGGYPRIATVVPDDLPIVAQAAPGDALRFRFVTLEEALADHRRRRPGEGLTVPLRRLLRDPREMADLLGHQLISGVTDGSTEEAE